MPDGESLLNRREFLLLSAVGSAMLLLGETGRATLGLGKAPRDYGAFTELPAGSIRPEGWLRHTLEQQAAGLGAHLPDVSWPFTEPYWKGAEKGESWWPWEQKAYWIDGAARLAVVLDDAGLKAKVRETIDYTLAQADADGYLGPQFFKEPKEDYHRWPQNVFLRSLEVSGETGAADAIRKHYLGDAADYGKPVRNVTNIESMLWAYAKTGDPKLLALAEKAWADYQTIAADPEHGDLSNARVFAGGPIDAHGVTYMETAKQPAILYRHTGKEEYLRFALAAQKRVFDHHMLVSGIPSTSEWYRTTTALDAHETCCIADHTWSWGALMMATGDGAWGDRIERAVFNAGMGAIKKDWRAVQYFSSPNQVIATMDSSHVSLTHPEYGDNFMAYQPNPGRHTACCGGNVHRILPNYALRMWMRHGDGLAATLYGPSKLTTTVGRHHDSVTITQTTGYPFEETIHLAFDSERPVRFPLMLRVPSWSTGHTLTVNGKDVPTPPIVNGFVTLDRTFHKGDTVSLAFGAKVTESHWPDGGVAFERGPLVYALPVHEDWKPVVDGRYSTPEFPSWNATPTSPWNYAVAAEPRKTTLGYAGEVADRWIAPDLGLIVEAKRVEGWDLQTSPKKPGQRFTPPLPDLAKSTVSGDSSAMVLVPYGMTHLRLTIFPDARKA